jgi:hypothetical protein
MLGGLINIINTPQRFHANLPKASTKAKQSKNTLKMDVLKYSIFVVLFLQKHPPKAKEYLAHLKYILKIG